MQAQGHPQTRCLKPNHIILITAHKASTAKQKHNFLTDGTRLDARLCYAVTRLRQSAKRTYSSTACKILTAIQHEAQLPDNMTVKTATALNFRCGTRQVPSTISQQSNNFRGLRFSLFFALHIGLCVVCHHAVGCLIPGMANFHRTLSNQSTKIKFVVKPSSYQGQSCFATPHGLLSASGHQSSLKGIFANVTLPRKNVTPHSAASAQA